MKHTFKWDVDDLPQDVGPGTQWIACIEFKNGNGEPSCFTDTFNSDSQPDTGTVDVVHPPDEAISSEMFNQSSVRMGDWKAIHVSGQRDWKLYNIATDLGENTDVAAQHPDILQKLSAAYDKYAQDVGIVIPTSGPFSTLFPQVTANNTQTIDLAKMFAPGFPLNETKSGLVPPGT